MSSKYQTITQRVFRIRCKIFIYLHAPVVSIYLLGRGMKI